MSIPLHLLKAVLGCAGTDAARPSLMCPWIQHGALCATDSFVLLVWPGITEPEGSIPRDAIEMLASYKLRKPAAPELTVHDKYVTLPAPPGADEENTIDYPRGDYTMPDWRRLAVGEAGESPPVGINTQLLHNIGVALTHGTRHVRGHVRLMQPPNPNRPILVTLRGNDQTWEGLDKATQPFGLLMPVRL